MSKTEGEILACDVCGESVFLKYIGDGEADGGFSRWRKYEEAPKGWNTSRVYGIGDLCPECSRRINEVLALALKELSGARVEDE